MKYEKKFKGLITYFNTLNMKGVAIPSFDSEREILILDSKFVAMEYDEYIDGHKMLSAVNYKNKRKASKEEAQMFWKYYKLNKL